MLVVASLGLARTGSWAADIDGSVPQPVDPQAGIQAPGDGGRPQLPVSVSGEEMFGTSWTGPAPITETVDQIMIRAREADAFIGPRRVREQIEPAEREREGLPQNPYAPRVSSWPPGVSEGAVALQRTPIPQNPQAVGASFMGAQLSDSGYIPPDTMGAVGPDQILIVINGRIRVFDKTGAIGGLDATADSFFASVMTAGTGTSDPHVRYDRLSGRWFIVMIDLATVNKVLIAVSSGPHISNSSSFTFYAFEHDLVGTTPNTDTGGFLDYPTLGVDANALYIGGDIINSSGTSWIGASVYVVNKADLLAGTLTVTPFRQIGAAGGTGAGMWAPQGVDNDDPTAAEGYFIGVDNHYYSSLVLRRVSDPGGPSPSLSANMNVTVPTTYTPMGVPYRKASNTNKSITLDALDDRLFAAAVHKEKLTGISSLWTAHSILVNSSGVGSSGGDRDGCRWYQIGSLTATPALVQSGTLYDPAALNTNPYFYWMPSVAMSGQGHMALGCSSANGTSKTSPKYASATVAGRLSGDDAGATQAATIAFTGAGFYDQTDSSGRNRWGDYSQTVVDPTDDQTMWTFQEYVNTTGSPYTYGSWAVRAIQLKAPLPAAPSSCSPAAICQGAVNVSISVTGTSSSGTAFFDPDSSFPNHILASVSGAGVTVNSVTFTDITHVTLNLTVDSAATPGTRNITVTNPDGQTATGTGVLTITAAPAQPSAISGPAAVCQGQSGVSYSVTNVSGMTYNWSYSGAGATLTPSGNSVSVNFSGSATSGTLSVTATNASGCSSTGSTLAITVNAVPSTPTASNSGPICAGSTLYLFASAVPGATYGWTGPNGFISSVQNPIIPNATILAAGLYSVTATVGGCASAAGTTTVTVNATSASPTFVSALPVPDIIGASAQQVLTLTTPIGSSMPSSFAFTWDSNFAFNPSPSHTYPLGFWQEMRPYGTPFVPTAFYPILWSDTPSPGTFFADVNGNGTYDPLTDYLVTPSGNTVTVSRTVGSGSPETQAVGYRLVLQSALITNPVLVGDYPVTAVLSLACGGWSGSLNETITTSPSGCPLNDVGNWVRLTKSGTNGDIFTVSWADTTPSTCLVEYGVFTSTDCRHWEYYGPFATVDKTQTGLPPAGTGVNVTYFLVAEIGSDGLMGPLGHYGM